MGKLRCALALHSEAVKQRSLLKSTLIPIAGMWKIKPLQYEECKKLNIALQKKVDTHLFQAQAAVKNDQCQRQTGRNACDNGPEFLSGKLVEFCNRKNTHIRYIQPGKPTQHAYVERFNRSYREDMPDAYLLESIDQIRALSEN